MAYDVVPDRFAPVEVDEVGQIILRARELLSDPKRWCKGALRRDEAFCTVGALCEVAGFPDSYWLTVNKVGNAVYERVLSALPYNSFTIAYFNDNPSTTHADVLALLDRAASQPMKGSGK